MLEHIWICACCGQQQNGLPLDFFASAPDQWFNMPEERLSNPDNRLDENLCMIGGKDFFVRGCVEVPIVDREEKFTLGLWVSVAEDNFKRVLDLWTAEVENEPPMFGLLCNDVSLYPASTPTLGLKTSVRLRNNNQRPAITLEPTDHPFAADQRNGVSLAKVEEMVAALLPHR
jgi:hypothetical protein